MSLKESIDNSFKVNEQYPDDNEYQIPPNVKRPSPANSVPTNNLVSKRLP